MVKSILKCLIPTVTLILLTVIVDIPFAYPGTQECVKVWSGGVLEWWSDGEKENFYTSNTPTLHYSNTPSFLKKMTQAYPGTQDPGAGTAKKMEVQVPPPPLSEGIFPCSECHAEMETNPERRELEDMHDEIVLKHDEQNRWCLDCHDAKNRDMLHLADGRLVDFKESYKLCGQCHGPKLRDWRNGVHGRRTGSWNGPKKYLLCAHCHNPHTPRFEKLKPDPAPVKPENLR